MSRPSPVQDIRQSKTIRLRTAPSWLPEKYRHRLERLRIKFKPSPGERRFFKRRKIEQPSVWAPKNRVVTYGPLENSRWDNSFMPHMRGIMDASFFPSVRYIGNCKAPQSGSSAGVETLIGYVADLHPGPMLIVYPNKDTASKRSTDYLQPMFQKSPRLRSLLTGAADDMASMRIKLQTMLLYMGWSGSVTALANVSARYLIGDEIDKWEVKASKKEANTLTLFYERFRSFVYGAKCWLISTPSDVEGYIWVFMTKEAQVIFDYHIPCPECGELHKMSDKHIRFGEERDPKVIEEQDLARYVFPCCGLVANDRVRIAALQKGIWYERLTEKEAKEEKTDKTDKSPRELFQCLRETKPRKICFHSPGWISPLFTNSEIAAAFLRGLKDPEAMHYYDNQVRAVAHVPYRLNRKIDTLKNLKDDRPFGLVPGNNQVAALVAGIDTQDHSFLISVRAFGYSLIQPSWQIRHDEVTSFAELEKILFEDAYQDSAGLYYPIHLALIDTGGHRTGDVYDFCRKHPGRVLAYKGASGRKASPKSKTIIDTYPGTKIPIPGGVELWVCDSHHYKDHLAAKLRAAKDSHGAYLFAQETSEEFLTQMTAEYVDDKRMWQCPKGRANHYWDTSVLELIAADMLQLKYTPNPNQGE